MSARMIVLNSREEWLERRKNYIGGSDASAIVGMNPYKDNVRLWLEKTGQVQPADISDKPYVMYGSKAEHHLRELFSMDFPEYEVFYEENNMWLNDKFPFAHASLDGWLIDSEGRKGVWECKTTNIIQSMQKEKWDHRIPDNYYIQCLWYLAVTEFDFVVLKAQLKSEFKGDVYIQTRHYKFERADVQDDINYLMEKGAEFWTYVKTDRQPPLILPNVI